MPIFNPTVPVKTSPFTLNPRPDDAHATITCQGGTATAVLQVKTDPKADGTLDAHYTDLETYTLAGGDVQPVPADGSTEHLNSGRYRINFTAVTGTPTVVLALA